MGALVEGGRADDCAVIGYDFVTFGNNILAIMLSVLHGQSNQQRQIALISIQPSNYVSIGFNQKAY